MALADEVRDVARVDEPERYLAALLAPRDRRDDLIVLAAFATEVRRIPWLVSEPMLGEVRLQWWRDQLAQPPGSAATGAPVADALCAMMRRRGWAAAAFEPLIEATSAHLYADPIADEATLLAEVTAREAPLFRHAALVFADAGAPPSEPLIAAAGAAYGLTRQLIELPRVLAKGRVPLPVSWLDGLDPAPMAFAAPDAQPRRAVALARCAGLAREKLAEARRLVTERRQDRAAFLPLALVEPYLQAYERGGHDPLRQIADIAPLTRAWRLWRANRSGRW